MQQYLDFIKKHGVLIKDVPGATERALKREDAITAIELLRDLATSNLGGDVVVEKDGEYEHYLDGIFLGNWHTEKNSSESEAEYVTRSLNESRKYIENYPQKIGLNYFYLLVPKGKNI